MKLEVNHPSNALTLFLVTARVTVEHAKPDRSRGYRGGGGGGYGGDRRDYGRRDGGNSFRDRLGFRWSTIDS